ncbi:hypothetical protein DFS34DRAFT_593102 [Phlyctochytrium arcticum]|nr:hypothetical protein DFS34DRAFT_593102 [Phlyctochytrium arcticum]
MYFIRSNEWESQREDSGEDQGEDSEQDSQEDSGGDQGEDSREDSEEKSFFWRAFEFRHAPDLPISLRVYYEPNYYAGSEDLVTIYEKYHEGGFFPAVREFLANLDIVKEREVLESVRETSEDRRDIFCCMLPRDSWESTAKQIAEALERQTLIWRLRTPLKLSILVRKALSDKYVLIHAVLAFAAIHGVERTKGVLEAFELLSDQGDSKSCDLDSL